MSMTAPLLIVLTVVIVCALTAGVVNVKKIRQANKEIALAKKELDRLNKVMEELKDSEERLMRERSDLIDDMIMNKWQSSPYISLSDMLDEYDLYEEF